MEHKGHNCNLCKNTTLLKIGKICIGKKFEGKIIEKDDKICDEYEFGGFIDLSQKLTQILDESQLII